ncbi:MAG: 3-oxoacyl-(acyl-carrier-protein) reductase [Alphaproteobacteria bacterium]|nr:3-oxoacyl-(acyl-carrier-protein) reductase [Alphaproteobacteria bacterium]
MASAQLNSLFDLAGQVAVVTGGASGLGREFCQVLAEAGAAVVCGDRDEPGAEKVASGLRGSGFEAFGHHCDVTDERSVAALFAEVDRRFGRLDILFANAGIADPVPARIHEYDTENWRKVLAVDLDGVFYSCREAIKLMLPRGRGKVINIASMWGLAGASSVFPVPAYNAAKGAVVNLTRELALEYAADNIQVNALCPGFYRTNLADGAYGDPDFVAAITAFTPMGRIAEAHEIRGPALFLASSASDFVTGITLVTDGGCMAK